MIVKIREMILFTLLNLQTTTTMTLGSFYNRSLPIILNITQQQTAAQMWQTLNIFVINKENFIRHKHAL